MDANTQHPETQAIEATIKAEWARNGRYEVVRLIAATESRGFIKAAYEVANPAFGPDRAFIVHSMRADLSGGLHWGHYDLTETEALQAVA